MKNYWKYIIISLIATIMIFHFTAIWYIKGRNFELTSKDYYEQEQQIDSNLQALRLGKILQWNCFVEDRNRVVVEVVGLDGKPSQLKEVNAKLYRPNNASGDVELALGQQAPGRYVAEVADLDQGRWDLRVQGKKGEDTVAFEQKMSVQ